MGRRPLQQLRRSALLGDVFDVGDRQRHAVVFGDRHPGAGPDELAVGAQVALVEQVGVGDAERQASPVGLGGAEVVGVGHFTDGATDEIIDRALQHLGQRPVGVEDHRVVETHERHPCRRRVERQLEPASSLLQCPAAFLPLGHVTQSHHQRGAVAGRRLGVGFDLGHAPVVAPQPERHRLTVAGQPALDLGPPGRFDHARKSRPTSAAADRRVSSADFAFAPLIRPAASTAITASG